jgi:hypothetical protein
VLEQAVMRMAYTYGLYNPAKIPDAPGATQPDFLNRLWWAQNEYQADQLDDGMANLATYLQGVEQPAKAMQFVSNLLMAAKQTVGIQEDLQDLLFFQELLKFGFEYAKLNPDTSLSAEPQSFLKVLWQAKSGTAEFARAIKTGAGGTDELSGLSNFFDGLSNTEQRLNLLAFGRKLLEASALSQDSNLQLLMQNPRFTDDLIELGSAYASVNPETFQDVSVTPLNSFLDSIWEEVQEDSLLSNEVLLDLSPLAKFFRLQRILLSQDQVITASNSDGILIAAIPDKLAIKVAQKTLKWLAGKGDDISTHIIKRHLAKRIWGSKSKFINQGSSVKKLTERTLKNPDRAFKHGEQWYFEKKFNRSIGTQGEKIVRVRVGMERIGQTTVTSGKIFSVYPVKEFFSLSTIAVSSSIAIQKADEADTEIIQLRTQLQRERQQSWIVQLIDLLNPIDEGGTATNEDFYVEMRIIESKIQEAFAETQRRLGKSLTNDEKEEIRTTILSQIKSLD